MGVPTASAADAVVLERAARERLLSWGIPGVVDAVFVTGLAAQPVAASVLAFLGDPSMVHVGRDSLIVCDPAMHALMAVVAKVAPAPLNLLILGETGVGKDMIASLVHQISPRAAQRLVTVNCASLPEPLLESELFGHERGAFTGAVASKPGLLEEAEGGTIFFDEIGELPPTVQAKLLRSIESREITRIGGLRPRSIDVRFVAATNRDLVADVATGRFRQDLFFRLDGLSLTVPPLRDRPCEILPLARHFVTAACQRFSVPRVDLSAPAADALTAHRWPGNIRELRNAIERAVVLAGGGGIIEPAHLKLSRQHATTASAGRTSSASVPPPPTEAPAMAERDRIIDALTSCAGNQRRAAALLDMPLRTLVRRIGQLGLPRPRRAP
jgi:two-component system, NtrC family, response regulator AtoC